MNLYPYQVDDHDWLVADGRAPDVALLWHELGVGKTTVAAAAAATLAARGWGVLALGFAAWRRRRVAARSR